MALETGARHRAVDPYSIPLGADPDRYDLGGIPLYHLPLPGSTTIVSLSFGTGRADEPVHRTGITHLAEHLILDGIGEQALDGNGRTEPFRVSFSLHGSPDEASGFLRDIGRSIRDPLLGRINQEVSVLWTEEDMRSGGGIPIRLAWLRYGNAGLGACRLPELFLRGPEPEVLADWISRHMVAGNAAIWVAGILPDDLEIELPPGDRFARPVVPPIDGLATPTLSVEDMGGVGTGFIVQRSAVTMAALHIAERRLRRALRIDRSLGYLVDLDYVPVDATTAHVALYATCQAERVAEVEGVLLTTLDDLANRGPDPEEIRHGHARLRRGSAEPMAVPARLDSVVRDVLLGTGPESVADLDAEYAAIDNRSARFAMARALDTMVLAAPGTGFVPNRNIHRYPGPSSVAMVDPTRFPGTSPRGKPWAAKPKVPTLVASPVGAAVEAPDGTRVSCVPWAECVAYVRDPGRRSIFGRDGFILTLAADDWRDGEAAFALLDRFAPVDVLAPGSV